MLLVVLVSGFRTCALERFTTVQRPKSISIEDIIILELVAKILSCNTFA